jgi:hypothetical protein
MLISPFFIPNIVFCVNCCPGAAVCTALHVVLLNFMLKKDHVANYSLSSFFVFSRVQAVANESGLNFMYINGPELLNMVNSFT